MENSIPTAKAPISPLQDKAEGLINEILSQYDYHESLEIFTHMRSHLLNVVARQIDSLEDDMVSLNERVNKLRSHFASTRDLGIEPDTKVQLG